MKKFFRKTVYPALILAGMWMFVLIFYTGLVVNIDAIMGKEMPSIPLGEVRESLMIWPLYFLVVLGLNLIAWVFSTALFQRLIRPLRKRWYVLQFDLITWKGNMTIALHKFWRWISRRLKKAENK